MRKLTVAFVLAVLVVIAWRLTRRSPENQQQVESRKVTRMVDANQGHILIEAENERASKWVPSQDMGVVLTNSALPAFKSFLQALANVGMSPLDPNLATNTLVVVEAGENNYVLECKFVVDAKWIVVFSDVADTDLTRRFVGISHLEQTGPENPYRAVSGGDTNRLAALARKNVMERETAVELFKRALSSLVPVRVGEPVIFVEKYQGYELNRWRATWWKQGADRMNQLNIGYEMAIAAENPTQGVVVLYADAVSWSKE